MKNIESNFKESRKYKPNKNFADKATITDNLLADLNESYKKNADIFWSNLANKEITWLEKFKTCCTGNAPDFEWFKEGKLNVSANCVDRHIDANNNAIIHISEDNQKKIITYKDLYRDVNNFSYSLNSIGLKKGSRVIIYMPTIPESIIAMLACARLGLVHSVVFAGFSSESLKNRINDCEAELVITVDSFKRNGKTIRS